MGSPVDLQTTSEIDMIAGAYVNVQVGERVLSRECQTGHAYTLHSEVDSLEQTPTGPHYSGTAELPFNCTYAQMNL